jgi:hypothetical protein
MGSVLVLTSVGERRPSHQPHAPKRRPRRLKHRTLASKTILVCVQGTCVLTACPIEGIPNAISGVSRKVQLAGRRCQRFRRGSRKPALEYEVEALEATIYTAYDAYLYCEGNPEPSGGQGIEEGTGDNPGDLCDEPTVARSPTSTLRSALAISTIGSAIVTEFAVDDSNGYHDPLATYGAKVSTMAVGSFCIESNQDGDDMCYAEYGNVHQLSYAASFGEQIGSVGYNLAGVTAVEDCSEAYGDHTLYVEECAAHALGATMAMYSWVLSKLDLADMMKNNPKTRKLLFRGVGGSIAAAFGVGFAVGSFLDCAFPSSVPN